jgi:crotonobetainyl-CoA:carnitine CoA-transferase CaiB-like acyl-CoA transferase
VPDGRVYQELCALFRQRTQQEWIETLAEVDACCEPVYTLPEALASDPVQALGMLTENGLLPPIQLSANPPRTSLKAPALGEQTAELLTELGYSQARSTI